MWKYIVMLCCGVVSSVHASQIHRHKLAPSPETVIRHIPQSSLIQPVVGNPQTLCLALGMYEEARGEPEAGQIGVAHVILNRVRTNGLSICQTLWQYGQFPWVSMPVKQLQPVETTVWTTIQTLAVRLMTAPGDDNTYGATEFYNPRKCHCRLPGRITTILNRHVFLAPAAEPASTSAGLPAWKTMVVY